MPNKMPLPVFLEITKQREDPPPQYENLQQCPNCKEWIPNTSGACPFCKYNIVWHAASPKGKVGFVIAIIIFILLMMTCVFFLIV
jgi:hypothetical protein